MLLFVAAVMAALISSAVVTYRSRKLAELERPQRVTLIPARPGETAGVVQEDDAPGMPDMPDFRGKPAPQLQLKDLDGKPVRLSDLRGKAVLVNFWATWCAPCKIETPWIVALSHQYGPQGFAVLGVSADDPGTTNAEIQRSAQQLHIDYPVLVGGESVAKQWGGLDALPTSFYIGRDGKVVAVTRGLYTRDEMEANVKKALGSGA